MLPAYCALTVAALFAGAAFYVSFAEQPARLGLDDRALLVEWKRAYARGLAMQAPLAIVGFALGAMAWWLTWRHVFLIGAILLLANWPWTIFVMMATNRALMTTETHEISPNTRALIVKWNRLHTVRITLGVLAILAFLVGLSSNSNP
jgi:hypothetical protein